MDPVCPYLALADDARTAVAGYDPSHTCQALEPPEAVERERQGQLCLTEAHPRCERYRAAEARVQRDSARFPRPAPDAVVVSTRMVLDPDPGWRRLGAAPIASSPRARRLIMVGVVAVLAVAAAVVAFGGLGAVLFSGGAAASSPTPTTAATASPTPTATPEATATPSPTPTPTPRPTATPSPTPTAAPTPVTYVVQAGDTLGSIAARFGVSVQALMSANGLTSTIINIGQVLIIP